MLHRHAIRTEEAVNDTRLTLNASLLLCDSYGDRRFWEVEFCGDSLELLERQKAILVLVGKRYCATEHVLNVFGRNNAHESSLPGAGFRHF